MTDNLLTSLLAEQILGWRTGPKRFLERQRQWTPRWRFQPLRHIAHALQPLEKAGRYNIAKAAHGTVTAAVTLNGRSTTASAKSEPTAPTLAPARTLGIDVERID